MTIRWVTTCTASAAPLWVFTHRAIMFKLALMRLSIATLSRSSLRFLIVTLPKWSLTTSDMVMLADSDKSCRACHSASENRTRSMLFRVVMIPILQADMVLNKATPCCYTSFRTWGLVIGAYCPPEPPPSGYALRLPLVVASPTDAPPQGGLSVRHVAGGQGKSTLTTTTKRWVVPKASRDFRGINGAPRKRVPPFIPRFP